MCRIALRTHEQDRPTKVTHMPLLRRRDLSRRTPRAATVSAAALAAALVLSTLSTATSATARPGSSEQEQVGAERGTDRPAATKARRAASYDKFPTRGSTGVPRGWEPRRTVSNDLVIRRSGQVVQDIRLVGASLIIDAPDVTVRRVEILGGRITNVPEDECRNGLVVEDTTILPGDVTTRDTDEAAIGIGGYTARRVEMYGVPEGYRVGGRSMGCGPTKIVQSYAHVSSPDVCNDWHGDGIQGYDGPRLVVRKVRLILDESDGCGGTAPFFWPARQGNSTARIRGLLVEGGGISFRMNTPGSAEGIRIVDRSWYYNPIDVLCSALSSWEAKIVRLDDKGQPVIRRNQRCNTEES